MLLQHNLKTGVILTGNTNLALRNVSRLQAGKYSCTASNVEGDGKSQPLALQVVCKYLQLYIFQTSVELKGFII